MLCWNSGEDTHPHPAFCTPPSASTGSPSTFARAHFQRLHSHSPATDRSLGPPSLWTCPHAKLFFEHAREKKSQFPMGTGRFFFISDWLLSPTNQVQNTRGNTESGGLHAFMWLAVFHMCGKQITCANETFAHVICFPRMWYSNPHFKSGEICFSTFPHNSDAIWLFSHKISNVKRN